ncbi:hypothetical protein M407DRAFT_24526 [Tulasnella calospora MUT 4182]|uniref:Uncharacterized protein n=1 Tax=Tulasnella calospora MUT 4182 TaxID=1051891 RepID=A0A0C3QHQ7_9AGAM|nr:hypothetical protein M407DRAFT_24526 [Tulasnella calospora MUT 4182]
MLQPPPFFRKPYRLAMGSYRTSNITCLSPRDSVAGRTGLPPASEAILLPLSNRDSPDVLPSPANDDVNLMEDIWPSREPAPLDTALADDNEKRDTEAASLDQEFLLLLYALEPPPKSPRCKTCGVKSAAAFYRCKDCFGGQLLCNDCTRRVHFGTSGDPFHRVDRLPASRASRTSMPSSKLSRQHALLDSGLLKPVVRILMDDQESTICRREACWTISNLTEKISGDAKLAQAFIEECCVEALSTALLIPDPKVKEVAVFGITNVLEWKPPQGSEADESPSTILRRALGYELFDEIYDATRGFKRKNEEGAKLEEDLSLGDLVALEFYINRYSRNDENARHASSELVAVQLLRRGSASDLKEVKASVTPAKTDAFGEDLFAEM